jgi:hypothetical protein
MPAAIIYLASNKLYISYSQLRHKLLLVPYIAVLKQLARSHLPFEQTNLTFKTLQKIRENFTWKGMVKEIKRKVLGCPECGRSKPPQNTKVGSAPPPPPNCCYLLGHSIRVESAISAVLVLGPTDKPVWRTQQRYNIPKKIIYCNTN